MNQFLKRAKELESLLQTDRRYLHQHAEAGEDLPTTTRYVMERLREIGLTPTEICPSGVTALIEGAKPGKVLLLRADMDALPMPENNDLPFKTETDAAHNCGHDFHTAMLLCAAQMLYEHRNELCGSVKLMFQPAEENFLGSKNMIENGILENPKVDAALAYHVSAGKMPVGIYMYNDNGTMMYSVDGFQIDNKGIGSHGAYTQNSIEPINIGVHVYLALEAIMAREVDPTKACVMTVGQFQGGTAENIIPDVATLKGTIRSNDKQARELMVRRMKEVATKTAESYGGTAEITMLSEVPPLICDPKLTDEFVGYMKEMNIQGMMPYPGISASASEDFASIAEKVPSTFMYLSAGYPDERGQYGAHNPKVQFNEGVCPIGPSCQAYCATQWLKNNK